MMESVVCCLERKEKYIFYCETCKIYVCTECFDTKHQQHTCIYLKKHVTAIKEKNSKEISRISKLIKSDDMKMKKYLAEYNVVVAEFQKRLMNYKNTIESALKEIIKNWLQTNNNIITLIEKQRVTYIKKHRERMLSLDKEMKQREVEYNMLTECMNEDDYDRYIKLESEKKLLKSLKVLETTVGEEYYDATTANYNEVIRDNESITKDLLENVKSLSQIKPQVMQEIRHKESLVRKAKETIAKLNVEVSKFKKEYNNLLSENSKYTKLVIEEKKLVETLKTSLKFKSNQAKTELIKSPLMLRDILNLPDRIRSLNGVPCQIYSESQVKGNAKFINKRNFLVGALIEQSTHSGLLATPLRFSIPTIEYAEQFYFCSLQPKDKEYIQIDFCCSPTIESLHMWTNGKCMNEYSLYYSKDCGIWECARIFVHKGGWAVYNINAKQPYQYWKLVVEKYSGEKPWHSIQFFKYEELQFVS